ncbi:hypothetical protein J6590_028953 [Homalodisca vitripennis]|nr:hypothetical protein J6590_028953 [Homalodisca vitripennis]
MVFRHFYRFFAFYRCLPEVQFADLKIILGCGAAASGYRYRSQGLYLTHSIAVVSEVLPVEGGGVEARAAYSVSCHLDTGPFTLAH